MSKVKKKDHENLTSSNIQNVIDLLTPESGKPITKKEACAILNISYNTTRLSKIIEEFEQKKAYVADRKAKNRGKAASKEEIVQVISEYLQGETIADISKGLFRSSGFVKNIIEKIGVPQRPTSMEDKKGIDFLPDACVAEIFAKGEIVWSARYHTTAVIKEEITGSNKGMIEVDYEKKYGSKCYKIDVIEKVNAEDSMFPYLTKGGFTAASLAYDLGKLTHLEEYGVDLKRL